LFEGPSLPFFLFPLFFGKPLGGKKRFPWGGTQFFSWFPRGGFEDLVFEFICFWILPSKMGGGGFTILETQTMCQRGGSFGTLSCVAFFPVNFLSPVHGSVFYPLCVTKSVGKPIVSVKKFTDKLFSLLCFWGGSFGTVFRPFLFCFLPTGFKGGGLNYLVPRFQICSAGKVLPTAGGEDGFSVPPILGFLLTSPGSLGVHGTPLGQPPFFSPLLFAHRKIYSLTPAQNFTPRELGQRSALPSFGAAAPLRLVTVLSTILSWGYQKVLHRTRSLNPFYTFPFLPRSFFQRLPLFGVRLTVFQDFIIIGLWPPRPFLKSGLYSQNKTGFVYPYVMGPPQGATLSPTHFFARFPRLFFFPDILT